MQATDSAKLGLADHASPALPFVQRHTADGRENLEIDTCNPDVTRYLHGAGAVARLAPEQSRRRRGGHPESAEYSFGVTFWVRRYMNTPKNT